MANHLFLGDSNTVGDGIPLASHFAYRTCVTIGNSYVNLAKNGWYTAGLLQQVPQVLAYPNAPNVMACIGTNDAAHAVEVGTPLADLLDQYRSETAAFIAPVRAAGKRLIMVSAPRSLLPAANVYLEPMSVVIRDLCIEHTIGFLDLYAKCRYYDMVGLFSGWFKPGDKWHFDSDGHAYWHDLAIKSQIMR